MKKVAVFGNAGGGKSTLSKRLSEITGLPLYTTDKLNYKPGGIAVSEQDYRIAHRAILQTEQWLIDGFGSMETLWSRLEAADTLIYLDLPLALHVWWVTKRLLLSGFQPPEGWPENSPILRGSLSSYRVLWLCHTRLTPRYREYIQQAQGTKRVYHLRSPQQIAQFLKSLESQSLESQSLES